MKITFIILGVIVFLIILLLFLPITVDLCFENELMYKIRYSGITFFDSEKRVDIAKRKKRKKKAKNKQPTNINQQSEDNYFKKVYKQKGFLGFVKYFCGLLEIILKKLWWIIARLKFRKFNLDLTVASNDAADTAIQYGGVCCAVFPILSFLESKADFKKKSINVCTDFDKTNPEFKIEFLVTTRLIYFLTAAISALFMHLKLQRKESEKNERK